MIWKSALYTKIKKKYADCTWEQAARIGSACMNFMACFFASIPGYLAIFYVNMGEKREQCMDEIVFIVYFNLVHKINSVRAFIATKNSSSLDRALQRF